MRLTHLMYNRVVIARLVETSGLKSAYTTTTATYAHIRPLSGSKTGAREGVYNKLMRFYIAGDIDVQEGDKLRDDNGNYYIVVSGGVNRRTFGSLDFLEVDLEKN